MRPVMDVMIMQDCCGLAVELNAYNYLLVITVHAKCESVSVHV